MKQKVLIITDDNYEDMELHYPKYRLLEAGYEVIIGGKEKENIYKGKYGYPCKSDLCFDEISVTDFEALIIPGGYAPDKLRTIPKVLQITQEFDKANKLIAFICHAGWIPISAKILKGIQCTSYEAIKDDMVNAKAEWVDKEVVINKHFISSRCPDDLPKFCLAIIDFLKNSQKK